MNWDERLRTLELRAYRDAVDIDRLSRQIVAAGQEMTMLASLAVVTTPTTTPTTISGTTVGCLGSGNPVTSVVVTAQDFGTSPTGPSLGTLGTDTSDGSGNFSITAAIPTGGIYVNLQTSPISGFDYTNDTVFVNPGTSSTGNLIQLMPDSSHACVYICNLPFPTSLVVTDSVYGTCTCTYNSGTETWTGCKTVSYSGTSSCAAGSIAIQYNIEASPFVLNWQCLVQWAGHVVSGHACPLTGSTCSSTLGFSRQVSGTLTCSGTTTFTFAANANSPWGGTGGATVSFTL